MLKRKNEHMRKKYKMLGQGALFYFDRKQFTVNEMPYLHYNCQLFDNTDEPMEFIHVRRHKSIELL